MSFLTNTRDRVVEGLLLQVLNRTLLKPYGHLINLRVESAGKRLRLQLQLKGETALLHIDVTRYQLAVDGRTASITIHEMTTSREWLTVLVQEHLLGRPIKLPESVARIARQIL